MSTMKIEYRISLAALFSAMTAGGAWISLPIGPVPVVLSNLVATLAGVVLGPLWGFLSVLLYLLLGALGLPIFAGGAGGFGHFAGPTGGFLIGFALSALVAGFFADRKGWNPVRNTLAVLAGFVALYAVGLPWFDHVVERVDGLWASAVVMAPFMVGDVVKAILGALLLRALKPYLSRRSPEERA